MQILGIRVVSLDGAVLEEPLAARFGEAGGDIGRGMDCTLVLPDPERRISRRQVLIHCNDQNFQLRQVGANLSVEVDGAPLAFEQDVPIADGTQIRIGAYRLLVERITAPPTLPPFAEVRNVVEDMLAGIVKGRQRLLGGAPREALRGGDTTNRAELDGVDVLLGDSIGHGAPSVPMAAAYASLYRGLGLPAPAPAQQTAEGLVLVGALLRAAIAGTLTLLAARAVAKRELGAGATLAQTRENNPLKFAPDADMALAHLLGPQQRGFVAPTVAVGDAFADLQAHEVAVLAGARRALDEVLARFDPQALEQRLAPKGLWDNLRPGNREARLWTQFGAQHAQILREAEDEFDTLFGRAFREAYDQQLAALERGTPSDGN